MGLQYVVCSPADVVTLVRPGAFSFTLVQTSVTLGKVGSFGACGGAGAPGAAGAFGASGRLTWGTPGILAFGISGLEGGENGGRVNRLPSTSWPSIIDLPKSSTFAG